MSPAGFSGNSKTFFHNLRKVEDNMLEMPLYETNLGKAYLGDSLQLLEQLEDNAVNLAITSAPFALLRQKEYGNKKNMWIGLRILPEP